MSCCEWLSFERDTGGTCERDISIRGSSTAYLVVPFGRPPSFFARREETMAARSRSSIRFATSFAIANGFVGSRQASGGAATIFSSDDDARHERSSNVARKNLPVGRTYQRIRRSQTCQLIPISVDPAKELDQTARRCSRGAVWTIAMEPGDPILR